MSSVTVSLLRDLIPRRVRMIVQVLIISVYVICVDIALKAWFPEIHREIAAYVGLIITNCIIMGRLEAYASKNRPLPSLLDGLGAGLGYSIVLIAVATVRELLGFGTLLGLEVPLGGLSRWPKWTIMVTPPGAFFVLALWVWAARSYAMRRGAAPAGKLFDSLAVVVKDPPPAVIAREVAAFTLNAVTDPCTSEMIHRLVILLAR